MSDNHLIPEDTKIRCIAVRGGLMASSQKKTPYYEVEVEPIDGPYKGWAEPLLYRRFIVEVKPNGNKPGKSVSKVLEEVVEVALRCGWNGSDDDRMENGYGEAEFIAVVGIEKGGPKTNADGSQKFDEDGNPLMFPDRNRVKFINDVNGAAGVELDNVARASLGTQIRAARLSMKRPGPAKTTAPAPAAINGTGRRMPPL